MAKQRRVKRGERRKLIIEMATELFSKNGFSTSTRDIAAALGVTQALLYKYFDSKEALIEAVFKELYGSAERIPSISDYIGANVSLDKTYSDFYKVYYDRWDPDSLRLFFRAMLDGFTPQMLNAPVLKESVVYQIIGVLRHSQGLPSIESRSLSSEEFELAMVLHHAIIMLVIRKYIYKSEPVTGIEKGIELSVQTWLLGAQNKIKAIHDAWQSQKPVSKDSSQFMIGEPILEGIE